MLQNNLVLVRHGQSLWNQKNLFTGWANVDLSSKGIEEAKEVGLLLKSKQISFDQAFTSALLRAISTLEYILEKLNLNIPILKSWQLNEKHYGDLQGKNKKLTIEKYGKEQVQKWRRGFDAQPPLLSSPQDLQPAELYQGLKQAPKGENLEQTQKRVLSFWKQSIFPKIQEEQRVLIVAHGNSLRALMKYLENISDTEISSVEIKTGQAILYSINSQEKILKKEIC